MMDGEYAMGQCDGWKDTSRNHIVAFMISCMGMVSLGFSYQIVGCYYLIIIQVCITHVHNTSSECKTADKLLALIKEEKTYIEDKLNLKLIGWVLDASGESRAACIRLQEQFPQLIVADCYVHQVYFPQFLVQLHSLTCYSRCNQCLETTFKKMTRCH